MRDESETSISSKVKERLTDTSRGNLPSTQQENYTSENGGKFRNISYNDKKSCRRKSSIQNVLVNATIAWEGVSAEP